jgi:uncharacterized membrane protein
MTTFSFAPVLPVFPVVLIGVLHWLMPSLVPPTTPFGVRVPRDHADAPVIVAQRRRYRLTTAVVTAAALATVLIAARGWAGPVAVGAQLLAGLLVYLLARRRITAVKAAEDWFGGRRQVAVADTSLRTDPERYPWRWAVPAALVTAGTLVTGIVAYPSMPARLAIHFGASGRPDHYADTSVASAFAPVLTQVASTVLLLAVAWLPVRGRAQLDAEDPQAVTRHRRFVAATARALTALAACVSVTFLVVSLRIWQLIDPPAAVLVALVVVPGMLGLAVVLVVLVRLGQGGSRLSLTGPARTGARTVNRDDDRLYRWGLFYINRDDPAVFVPKRFGIGWTLNLARPATWLIFAATAVLLAAVAVLKG